MTELSYDREITALLVIDPYNDFISEGGLVWDRLRGVAEANNCIPHMQEILGASRQAGLRVCYALHHRYRTGDYETWKYIAPIQKANWRAKSFEYGTWRGEIRSEFGPLPGDIVACEHWCSSGFANTDLDQQLKTHGIHRLIIIGLIANTCVEATARFGAEFGLRRHGGERRDRELFRGGDARRARHQPPELRQCDRHHGRDRRGDLLPPGELIRLVDPRCPVTASCIGGRTT
jgi:nicotinamidase-related amidase